METQVTVNKRGITGTGLKIIALIAMFIDHVAAVLLTDYLAPRYAPDFLTNEDMQLWISTHPKLVFLNALMVCMRLIGRFGFPLFAFLIVEGFIHTRSVVKYALNLGIFAIISELPFNLAFISKLFYPHYQNVFFTLFLGLLCMTCMKNFSEKCRDKKGCVPLFYLAGLLLGAFIGYLLFNDFFFLAAFIRLETVPKYIAVAVCAVISLIIFSVLGMKWDVAKKNVFTFHVLPLVVLCMMGEVLHTDYGAGGVLTIATMYMLRANKTKAFNFGCIVLTLMSPSEVTAFLMLIPVSMYNGQRGMKLNKYFFYAFYPVHLGLIYLLTLLLGFTTFALR
ncbi:MAG: hypothetical protein J6Z22_09110 [Lachnospiraceae bacterium]|nr:hypothetical protein [Lachnospiraceae bacterium]